MAQLTARNIIGALDRHKMASELGVHISAVAKAYSNDLMPASWFARVKAMCEAVGLPCPLSAFNWRNPPAFDEAGEILPVTSTSAA